ncbi:hypothetical protein BD413DRAFT_628051 [Trametes elegans]|nr:hypothetical protein BD413DRAFT_628051 [Trametes elegans]
MTSVVTSASGCSPNQATSPATFAPLSTKAGPPSARRTTAAGPSSRKPRCSSTSIRGRALLARLLTLSS